MPDPSAGCRAVNSLELGHGWGIQGDGGCGSIRPYEQLQFKFPQRSFCVGAGALTQKVRVWLFHKDPGRTKVIKETRFKIVHELTAAW